MKDQYDEDESVVKEAEKDHRFEKLKAGDGVSESDQEAEEEPDTEADENDEHLVAAWSAHQAGDKDGWMSAMKKYMGK